MWRGRAGRLEKGQRPHGRSARGLVQVCGGMAGRLLTHTHTHIYTHTLTYTTSCLVTGSFGCINVLRECVSMPRGPLYKLSICLDRHINNLLPLVPADCVLA